MTEVLVKAKLTRLGEPGPARESGARLPAGLDELRIARARSCWYFESDASIRHAGRTVPHRNSQIPKGRKRP